MAGGDAIKASYIAISIPWLTAVLSLPMPLHRAKKIIVHVYVFAAVAVTGAVVIAPAEAL